MGAKNVAESAFFTGGVDFESAKQLAGGHSGEMRMQFVARAVKQKAGSGTAARLQTIYASQGAILRQAPRPGSSHPQAMTMTSEAMTFALNENQELRSAETGGAGELTMRSADPKQRGAGERSGNASLPAAGAGSGNASLPAAGAGAGNA
jgi:hypothetical protein